MLSPSKHGAGIFNELGAIALASVRGRAMARTSRQGPQSRVTPEEARRARWVVLILVLAGSFCVLPGASAADRCVPGVGCVGDCDGNGRVTIDELTVGVGMATGAVPSGRCPQFSASSPPAVDDLISAVRNALAECPLYAPYQTVGSSLELLYYAVTLADVDSDGALDIITVDGEFGGFLIFYGQGDGTFPTRGGSCAGCEDGTISVATADLNGDKILDFVTANQFSDDVSVVLGLGERRLGPETLFRAGRYPVFVTIADMNRDDVPDVIVANNPPREFGASGDLSVLLGRGDGTFADQRHFMTADGPISIAVAELTVNAIPVLFASNSRSNDVSILIGHDDGTLDNSGRVPVGPGPISIATGDFNEDMEPDIVTANGESNTISIVVDVTSTPSNRRERPISGYPLAVLVFDADLDSKPDVASANVRSGDVSVLLGKGGGELGAERRFRVAPRPNSIAAGDLNGDAFPDIVTSSASTLSVLLSCRAPGPSNEASKRR